MGGFYRFRRSSLVDVPTANGGQKEKGGGGGRKRRGKPTRLGWQLLRLSGLRNGLNRRRSADLQRVGPHRLGDVLQRHRTQIADPEIESRLDLPIGIVGDANPTGLGDAL